jgi:CHASE2 domain-containing sensor protein
VTPRRQKADRHRHARGGFRRHLLRAMPVILVMTLLTTWAERMGLFDSWESIALDAYVASAAPHTAEDVSIVTITDADYENPALFGGRSPLDPVIVKQLVNKITERGPAVVGVDITTAEPAYQTQFPSAPDRVIWVRDAIREDAADDASEPAWRLDRVLGRDTPAGDPHAGVSLFQRDPDGFVRRYLRRPTLTTASGSVTPASLSWSILQTYCAAASHRECGRIRKDGAAPSHESLWFNFAGDRYSFHHIPAGAIDAAPDRDFKDKIVLLGGTFAAARDQYPTPLGQKAGVELTAFAIASELEGGGITAANHALMSIVELAIAVALVWLGWRWPPGSRLNAILTSAAIVVFAIAGSYIAFSALGSWVSFVPFGVGIWIEQLYHGAREAKHNREQLEEYRRRYGTL